MSFWFSEKHSKNLNFSIKVSEQICSIKSKYQKIEIFNSEEFGKILVLDGYLMLTEKDEFIYHEMLTHVPMAIKNCEKILIIGGGDGGILFQLSKYKFVKKIDIVEIDELVVKTSKENFSFAKAFDDPRINISFSDGMKYIRSKKNEYDLIIVDSTDPFGPGEALFTKEFYGNCYNSLNENGIMVNQHESVFYEEYVSIAKRAHKILNSIFFISKLYQANIPTYPSGHWLFSFSSKKYHPIDDINSLEWDSLGISTKYYNTKLHIGSFYLPNYVKEIFKN